MDIKLPSWKDTPTRGAILGFVAKVCDSNSADYVVAEERVATFDNDGTLWCEQPAVQGGFIMQRLTAMAEKDASLRQTQPWKMAHEKDSSWINNAATKQYNGDDSDIKVLLGGLGKAFADMTVEAFAAMVLTFLRAHVTPNTTAPTWRWPTSPCLNCSII